MIGFCISAIKIIFLLGFLIIIHESGHFIVAKICKVKVNEFAIGFGPVIWKKQGLETKYALRLIPLGGFVSMEGEEEASDAEGSFSKASIPKRMAIVIAGATVNIVFGLIAYFILMTSIAKPIDNTFASHIYFGLSQTAEFCQSIVESLKSLIVDGLKTDQMMGIVGISDVVVSTNGIKEFIYILSLVSVSLGVTNLLPIPALDGGKLLLLIIEAIRRKPLKQETEASITLLGFSLLIVLSIYVTYNDILRIF
ncbi:MAG: site-2 protease family protein [Clostridia bacterium]|nr:site-2 protease family protein [Clostridia bacterium]